MSECRHKVDVDASVKVKEVGGTSHFRGICSRCGMVISIHMTHKMADRLPEETPQPRKRTKDNLELPLEAPDRHPDL